MYGILCKRINICDHSLGVCVCTIILCDYQYVTQPCEFRCKLTLLPFISKNLLTVGEAKPVGIPPNRILQTPLLTHFASSCQQPRLSQFESSIGNWVNQNIVDLKKFKAVEKNCKGKFEPKGNFSVQSEHEIEFIFRVLINSINLHCSHQFLI